MTATSKIPLIKIKGNSSLTAEDILAVEEPLEIRLSYIENSKRIDKNISITMRTPGNDEELALGFLFTEGIIGNYSQVDSIKSPGLNIISIILSENIKFETAKIERHFYTSSSCGVCGKSSIDAVTTSKKTSTGKSNISFRSQDLYGFPEKLRSRQDVFEQTGGLHASALFDVKGELILAREDVGRHNALDKLIGASLMENKIPLNEYLLLLSGRASFELIQKAYMADINIIAAVGAPSSLAFEFACEKNMTLMGFLKGDRFNIYCGEERIIIE